MLSVMNTARQLGGFIELEGDLISGSQVHVYLPAENPKGGTRFHR
jgi:hypothetical protein